jgi:hypothetical protein
MIASGVCVWSQCPAGISAGFYRAHPFQPDLYFSAESFKQFGRRIAALEWGFHLKHIGGFAARNSFTKHMRRVFSPDIHDLGLNVGTAP